MTLAIILLICCVLAAVIGSILYTRRRVDGVYNDVQNTINGFFSGGSNDTPSRFHQTVDSVGQIIGDRLQTQMEARMMARKSHEARAENLLTEDIVTDIASGENPLLGVALEALPSVRKRLAKNPTALAVLLPMLAKFGKGGQANKPGSDGRSSDVAQRIKGGT